MAEASGFSVTTTGTGGSDHIALPPDGDYIIQVTWAGSAGDADLQAAFSGSTFVDVEDSSGVVNITANKLVRVAGGGDYRLDVNTHTSAATMTASRVSQR